MDNLSLLWTIVVTIVGAILGGVVRFFTYKTEQEKELAQIKLDNAVLTKEVEGLKYVTDHLSRAGEDMKKEFSIMNNMLTQVLTEIKHISKDLADLKTKQ
jgi:hypothetical protein